MLGDHWSLVEGALVDNTIRSELLQARGADAQNVLNILQLLAETPDQKPGLRALILKILIQLSKRSGLCPECLTIKNVEKLGDFPVGGGGFGDVWKGRMGELGERIVCLKVVKVYLISDVKRLIKEYMREAILWKQLNHRNLVPFIGMYYLDEFQQQICLVSPWMDNGNLVQFIREQPPERVDHQVLAYDVAACLAYLHEMKIVHGDLKGVNILITNEKRAAIPDFGLSRVADIHSLRSTTTASDARGTIQWLAPELLRPPSKTSRESDVYAYACVCYEIFTTHPPFHELPDGAVIVAVLLDKRHPGRPRNGIPALQPMWSLTEDCWMYDPAERPDADQILARVGRIPGRGSGHPVEEDPGPEWEAEGATSSRVHIESSSLPAYVTRNPDATPLPVPLLLPQFEELPPSYTDVIRHAYPRDKPPSPRWPLWTIVSMLVVSLGMVVSYRRLGVGSSLAGKTASLQCVCATATPRIGRTFVSGCYAGGWPGLSSTYLFISMKRPIITYHRACRCSDHNSYIRIRFQVQSSRFQIHTLHPAIQMRCCSANI